MSGELKCTQREAGVAHFNVMSLHLTLQIAYILTKLH
jgi:hypothetical protein